MNQPSSPTRPGRSALIGGSILAIFAVDCLTPLGYGAWLLYVVLPPLSARPSRRHDAVGIASIATVLVVAGFFLSPRGGDPTVALVSRSLGLVVLWLTAMLVVKRNQTEAALRESEERLRLSTELGDVAVWEYDFAANRMARSTNHDRLYGLPWQTNWDMNTFLNATHPDDRALSLETIQKSVAPGGPDQYAFDFRAVHRDQSVHWLTVIGQVVERTGAGQGTVVRGCLMDISERMRAEDQMRRATEALRLSIEHSPAAIAMFDREMKYIAFSRRFVSDYGLGEQGLMGRSHYEVFPEIPERWKEIHRRCLAGAIEKAEEDPFPRADGRLDWVRWEIRPWHEPDGQIGGIALFSEVVTERKQAQEELRRLSGRQLQAQDAERRRLARELHDQTAQQLAAIAMNLSSLQRLAPDLAAKAGALLAETQALTERASQEIRTLSYLLHPPVLEEVGLVAAVRDYASGFARRASVRVAVEADPALERLPDETELALFRIVQESLANVVRHSGSPTATVRFTRDAEEICLEVIEHPLNDQTRNPTSPASRPGLSQFSSHLWQTLACVGALAVAFVLYARSEQPITRAHELLALRALKKNNILNQVVVARDGALALDYLFGTGAHAERDLSEPPQVVLLDLKLPKISGLEVLQRLRADERTRLQPVVILTSSAEEQDNIESYGLGANSYVRKPVDFSRFSEAVRQIGLYCLVVNERPPVL